MEIVRMIEEKQKEEDLIKIRTVEEMVSRRFHKYLKVFEKKELEKMLIRKIWDYVIESQKRFYKKGKIYLFFKIDREEVQEFLKSLEKRIYLTI